MSSITAADQTGTARRKAEARHLPIIDVAGLRSAQQADRREVAAAMRLACMDRGFFYITGHGVDPGLIARTWDQVRALFDLPTPAKRALDKSGSGGVRGYEPLRGQTLEPGAPADLKEGFYIGRELGPLERPADPFNQAANRWPLDLPAFREVMLDYHRALLALSRTLMRGLALSLDMAEDAFDAFGADPIAILRLLHYPPQFGPDPAGAKGAGAHTDFGALTILLQDEVGGLEVYDQTADSWTPAPPLPEALIVNLGDLIARWTNDRYRSTRHRVINVSGRRRYSIPFFLSGAPDYLVACLPACFGPGQQPKYPPTTVLAHLQDRYRQTYGR